MAICPISAEATSNSCSLAAISARISERLDSACRTRSLSDWTSAAAAETWPSAAVSASWAPGNWSWSEFSSRILSAMSESRPSRDASRSPWRSSRSDCFPPRSPISSSISDCWRSACSIWRCRSSIESCAVAVPPMDRVRKVTSPAPMMARESRRGFTGSSVRNTVRDGRWARGRARDLRVNQAVHYLESDNIWSQVSHESHLSHHHHTLR
ncbi:hypothetical protein CITRIK5_20456 [Citricoccus sp. K5]|nr:hypothetical protein CITRIK5_20456 [Citricoccus sp. K5]